MVILSSQSTIFQKIDGMRELQAVGKAVIDGELSFSVVENSELRLCRRPVGVRGPHTVEEAGVDGHLLGCGKFAALLCRARNVPSSIRSMGVRKKERFN